MSQNGFERGQLTYRVASGVSPQEAAEQLKKEWQDGYVAFANGEIRLSKLNLSLDERLLAERLLAERLQDIQQIGKLEGYVTELNLWCSEAGVHKEIILEREENSYLVQTLELDKNNAEGNCRYCSAPTRASSYVKGREIFSDLMTTIEVVWPEKRLNFYISGGE